MSGTRVTAMDLDSGESDSVEIRDNYVVITDGRCEISHEQRYANGTTVITLKYRPSVSEVPLCRDCHGAHHARSQPIPRAWLLDDAQDFADEHGLGWLLEKTYV